MKKMKQMICPHCRNDIFHRTTKEDVKINDDGKILQDDFIGNEVITYKCKKCKMNVTEEELERQR